MQEVVGRLEENLMGLVEKIDKNHVDMKTIAGKLEENLVGMSKMVNEKVETLKGMNKIVNGKVDRLKGMVNEKVEAVMNGQKEVQREVKDVKENLSNVNKDVDEIKVMMSQVLDKLNMFKHLNKLPSPTEGMLNTPREDILIAGGFDDETGTEIFSWEKNSWLKVSPMNEEHSRASSFIFRDQLCCCWSSL